MSTNLFNPSDHRIYAARWPLYRGKQLFQVIDERSKDGTEELLTVSHITGITPRKQKNVTMFQSESLVGYKICHVGDIAANTMWTWQGAIGVSSFDGVVSPAYNVYRQKEDTFNPRYLDMFLRERRLIDVYHSLSTGIRPSRLRLYPDVFLTITLPVPPREEQDQIVRFLDWKVSGINRLINAQNKQIQVIEEMKERIICDTLRRGIDTGVSYQDSGISWIGEIPEHWKCIKIKWLFKEAEERNENELAQLLTFSKKKGLIPFSESSEKTPSASDLSNYKLVHIGQLLENRMQAWHGMFICADKEGCVSPDYSVFSVSTDRAVNVKFYEYVFRSHIWVEQFANASRGIGSGFNRLYTPQFGAIYTVYPEIDEQCRIADFLDRKVSQLNIALTKAQNKIRLLGELKTRLISDVVTGKIDVRGIEIPEYEFVAEESATEESSIEESEMDSDYLSS